MSNYIRLHILLKYDEIFTKQLIKRVRSLHTIKLRCKYKSRSGSVDTSDTHGSVV